MPELKLEVTTALFSKLEKKAIEYAVTPEHVAIAILACELHRDEGKTSQYMPIIKAVIDGVNRAIQELAKKEE